MAPPVPNNPTPAEAYHPAPSTPKPKAKKASTAQSAAQKAAAKAALARAMAAATKALGGTSRSDEPTHQQHAAPATTHHAPQDADMAQETQAAAAVEVIDVDSPPQTQQPPATVHSMTTAPHPVAGEAQEAAPNHTLTPVDADITMVDEGQQNDAKEPAFVGEDTPLPPLRTDITDIPTTGKYPPKCEFPEFLLREIIKAGKLQEIADLLEDGAPAALMWGEGNIAKRLEGARFARLQNLIYAKYGFTNATIMPVPTDNKNATGDTGGGLYGAPPNYTSSNSATRPSSTASTRTRSTTRPTPLFFTSASTSPASASS